MAQEEIGDKIEVLAQFSKGRLIPKQFTWQQRDYSIAKISFSFSKQEGSATLLYFSVVGQTAAYELEFNLSTFIWRLTKTYLPEN